MAFRDVYVGAVGYGPDRLDWGGDPTIGNLPTRLSPFFPPNAPYHALVRDIREGRLHGAQIDWGAWATIMTRAAIEGFIAQHYGPPGAYEADAMPHLAAEMRALRAWLSDQPATQDFALVASESG